MNRIQKISAIAGLILAVATIVGIGVRVDSRYARAAEVKKVEKRLDQKIRKDRINWLQETMWKIEDRWTERFWQEFDAEPDSLPQLLNYMERKSEDARDYYRNLKAEYDELVAEQENGSE